MTTTIAITHHTRYTYGAPVEFAQHVAHLRPIEDERQTVEAFTMAIDPQPSHHGTGRDAFGNGRAFFALTQPHATLHVHADSRVRVSSRRPAVAPEATPPWEAVAERLRYAAGRPFEPAVQFALPSPYVPRLPGLRELAAESFRPGTPVAAGAISLMRRVHAEFAYESASTDIDTPLADVLAQGRGVCQDFAHVMIGALRMHGLAARYVSGYLLTTPPPGHASEPSAGPPQAGERPLGGQRSREAAERGGPHLLGADASHAWVAVWCPGIHQGADGDWLELDPTNDLLPDTAHVRLAVGRDYGDVTPLRGVIRGGGEHTLDVRVHAREHGREHGAEVARSV
jgi:transglutaminase-like putative cysteine protease